jgi:hypothetical protein
MVVVGTKRHFAATQQTVAFGGKADIEKQARGRREMLTHIIAA